MPDNHEPQADDNGLSSKKDGDRQAIFDERFAALTDGFGKACEDHNVETAIAIAIHPKEKTPIVFIRGHRFDIAEMTGDVLRQLTNELLTRLSGQ